MAKSSKEANHKMFWALRKFSLLNFGNVSVKKDENGNYAIISFVCPKKLKYPKGWNYSGGCFSKENGSNDGYNQAPILAPNMHYWSDFFK